MKKDFTEVEKPVGTSRASSELRSGWGGLSINITPTERWSRVILGLVGVVVGVVLIVSAPSLVVRVLEGLFIAAGIDLVVTGALGHCPLYAKLGHVPTSQRRSS